MRNSGYYSGFGGAYIPEILVATFDELEARVRHEPRNDPSFWESYERLMASYSGRATPLTLAEKPERTLRWGSDLHQARGPEPQPEPTRPTTSWDRGYW